MSAHRGTLPRLLLLRAFVRVRRPTVVHGPTASEGLSAHRGTLPRPRLRHAFVRVRRPTVAHCLTGGEGTSDHRVLLPRLHLKYVFALCLHWSFGCSCPRPLTSGPRTCACFASLATPPGRTRLNGHWHQPRRASWTSRRRGSLSGSGGGAAAAFTHSWLGVMCAREQT